MLFIKVKSSQMNNLNRLITPIKIEAVIKSLSTKKSQFLAQNFI